MIGVMGWVLDNKILKESLGYEDREVSKKDKFLRINMFQSQFML